MEPRVLMGVHSVWCLGNRRRRNAQLYQSSLVQDRGARAVRRGGSRTRSGVCGLGAHEDGGVRRACRHRRGRRPDGADHSGHHCQEQVDEGADGRRQQGRRRGCRGLPGRQGVERRPAQAHYPPVESIHDPPCDQYAVQLARSDAGTDDGPGQLRPLGQRGDALQDAPGVPRRGQGRRRKVQDGRDGLEAGGSDHHRRYRETDRSQVHLHFVSRRRRGCGTAGWQARRFDGQQPDRSGGAVARRIVAPPVRVRRQTHALQDKDHQDDVLVRHSHVQGYRARRRVPDAARHFHARWCDRGAETVLRRPAEEGAGNPRLEELFGAGRVQPNHVGREGIRSLGGARGGAAHHAHEGSGIPGEVGLGARSTPRVQNPGLGDVLIEEGMESERQHSAASVRAVEIGVAVVIFLFGALVVFDSYRLGARWGDDGPQAGYFPFYVGLLICASGAAILVRALRNPAFAAESFVSREELKKILTVLVPTVVYVSVIGYLGFYVASTLYIAYFMWHLGKYSWIKIAPVSIGVSVAFFLIFEIWFSVPLPKGPLEAALGLN